MFLDLKPFLQLGWMPKVALLSRGRENVKAYGTIVSVFTECCVPDTLCVWKRMVSRMGMAFVPLELEVKWERETVIHAVQCPNRGSVGCR